MVRFPKVPVALSPPKKKETQKNWPTYVMHGEVREGGRRIGINRLIERSPGHGTNVAVARRIKDCKFQSRESASWRCDKLRARAGKQILKSQRLSRFPTYSPYR